MHRSIFTALLGVVLLASCEKSATDHAAETTAPFEDNVVDVAALTAAEPDDPAALRTRVYRLTRHQSDTLIFTIQNPLERHDIGTSTDPVDPFAAPARRQPYRIDPPIDIDENRTLENYFAGSDVMFPAGASATYNAATEELEITHHLAGFLQIEPLLENLRRHSESSLVLRVEVYELPAPLVLELGESAAANSDHTPEWDAVQRLVIDGNARFITSLGTILRSGQRGRATAGKSITAADDYFWDEERKKFQPFEGEQFVGTQIEFDLVVGADYETIDINFLFEHHTSPPGERLVEMQAPDSDAISPLPVPVFHRHQITTQTVTKSGYQNLIGVWRPSVPPSPDHLADKTQVAFLKATVRFATPIERIR